MADHNDNHEEFVVDAIAQSYVVSSAHAYPDDEELEHAPALGDRRQHTSSLIPPAVLTYLTRLYRSITSESSNLNDLNHLYEVQFNRLTEKFYAKSPWPEPSIVKDIVGEETIFNVLYKELYFRHLYARCSVGYNDRSESYYNYIELFNLLLNADSPVDLELPNQWLWDIIDELIYQFQSWCIFRSRNLHNKSPEELRILDGFCNGEGECLWEVFSVLNVLYELLSKSCIQEQLIAQRNGDDPNEVAGEFGSRPLYKMLGYFSLIGLLRVHCLLGDYVLALKTIENIELNKKALFTRVTACHVTTYYYVGFAYMMMRRYPDAIKSFNHIQVFINRTKHYQTRSYQYSGIMKKSEQMYALLAICISVCPIRLDENIHSALRERQAENMIKFHSPLESEALATYKSLFLSACPKFINPNSPDFGSILASEKPETIKIAEPHVFQCNIFLEDVKNQLKVPYLRSFLKLYSSLGVSKLARVMGVPEESLRRELLVFKSRTHCLKWTSGPALSGDVASTTDLDFYLSNDIVHIAESRIGRKFADWYIRNINKCIDLINFMDK